LQWVEIASRLENVLLGKKSAGTLERVKSYPQMCAQRLSQSLRLVLGCQSLQMNFVKSQAEDSRKAGRNLIKIVDGSMSRA
jgi:hypothetical protein